jgi:hypothetical protein
MQPSSDVIFKYVDQEGARRIISNCTLKFARPSEMNDPFDVYIHDLFNTNLKDFLNVQKTSSFDQLITNPELFSQITGLEPSEPKKISDFLKSLPKAVRAAIKSEITALDLEEIDPDLKDERAYGTPTQKNHLSVPEHWNSLCNSQSC